MSSRRIALVTGSTSGIGLAIARAFAAQKHALVMVDIDDRVETVAEEFRQAGIDALSEVVDLSDESQTVSVARRTVARSGGCDILVNCAGTSTHRPHGSDPEESPIDVWNRVLRINLTAPYILSKELIPGMRQRRFGRIVNIASRAGRTYVAPVGSEYAASKAGLIGLTRHLAGTYAPDGITVNCVAPGRIDTPLASLSGADAIAAAVKSIPVGRIGVPEEIAAAVAFLASDTASYVTGTCIDVNGGAFMG